MMGARMGGFKYNSRKLPGIWSNEFIALSIDGQLLSILTSACNKDIYNLEKIYVIDERNYYILVANPFDLYIYIYCTNNGNNIPSYPPRRC